MPALQELPLQAPTMMEEHFHVEKTSKLYQKWSQAFLGEEEITFFLEEYHVWITGKIRRIFIDDASGNAPGANAHFRVRWTDTINVPWIMDLYAGLKIRMEAPTDEELIARSGWCEGMNWGEFPDEHSHCYEKGKHYISEGGYHTWYCDEHKPDASYKIVEEISA